MKANSVIRVLAALVLIALIGLVIEGCNNPFSTQAMREKEIITDKLIVKAGGTELRSGATVSGGLTDVGGGSGGTADGEDDLLVAGDLEVDDTLDVDGDIDLDGDGFDVNITAGFSMDADAASNINVAGAGVDLTLESEAGSLVLKGDEAVATAITLDANDAVTTGVTIQVGSVSGLSIGGGLTDIGGGSYDTADGDNDLGMAGDLEVDGELELDGALDADSTANIAGDLTLGALLNLSFADLSISDGDTITPTVSVYSLDTSGAVTITLAAVGTEGQLLVLINDDANATIIADTNLASSDGNAITLTNADDIAAFIYQDSVWHELLLISDS